MSCRQLMTVVATGFLCWLTLAILPGFTQEPPKEDTSKDRGMKKRPESSTTPQRTQWAIVIGIDYKHLSPSERPGLAELDNPENDALKIRDTLLNFYGYQDSTTFLLLGSGEGDKKATKDNRHYPK